MSFSLGFGIKWVLLRFAPFLLLFGAEFRMQKEGGSGV